MFYEKIDSGSETDIWIKWDSGAISKGKTGYIIQHMSIDSHLSCVHNNDYWEAWHVLDGKIPADGYEYDDNWSPIPVYLILDLKEEIEQSIDGKVIYNASIYFVPMGSSVYDEIGLWKIQPGSPANEIMMTYKFETNVDDFYIGSRVYEWDYKELLQRKLY